MPATSFPFSVYTQYAISVRNARARNPSRACNNNNTYRSRFSHDTFSRVHISCIARERSRRRTKRACLTSISRVPRETRPGFLVSSTIVRRAFLYDGRGSRDDLLRTPPVTKERLSAHRSNPAHVEIYANRLRNPSKVGEFDKSFTSDVVRLGVFSNRRIAVNLENRKTVA